MDNLTVISARHLGEHRLEIEFSNGVRREVDFKSFLLRFAHPDYDKYMEISEFKRFKIIDGNINWNDYHMIFTIEALYKGQI